MFDPSPQTMMDYKGKCALSWIRVHKMLIIVITKIVHYTQSKKRELQSCCYSPHTYLYSYGITYSMSLNQFDDILWLCKARNTHMSFDSFSWFVNSSEWMNQKCRFGWKHYIALYKEVLHIPMCAALSEKNQFFTHKKELVINFTAVCLYYYHKWFKLSDVN